MERLIYLQAYLLNSNVIEARRDVAHTLIGQVLDQPDDAAVVEQCMA